MTLKVVHGRADIPPVAPLANPAVTSSQPENTVASQQLNNPGLTTPLHSEAVVTTLRSTARTQSGERVSSVDNARDLAKKIAQKLRSANDHEAHTHSGLAYATLSGTNRVGSP